MRFLLSSVLLLSLLFGALPASAAKCKEMAPEPPAERPRVSLLHWPEIIIHPHVSIKNDASQPDGTGTVTFYGPIAHANEIENFYAALFRDKGWTLAPEYQLSNQYIFHRKNRRMSLTSEADKCMGYRLTLHAVPFDATKYKPEKPFTIEMIDKLNEKMEKAAKKKEELEKKKKASKPELSPGIKNLPHNATDKTDLPAGAADKEE